jgi:carbonic anhydrase/acetyltransferase-like protein (isoleucine patch superfamily)
LIINYNGIRPLLGKECFIAESAVISGRVIIQDFSSVWFGAVIRGEVDSIKVGQKSNLQDNCVVHADLGFPAQLGDHVSVGHGAIIHGATIGNNCLIGMGSILLNGCKIGNDSIVGAGSLVVQGAEFPERSLVLGSPARAKRTLSEVEVEDIRMNAQHYDEFRALYLASVPSG